MISDCMIIDLQMRRIAEPRPFVKLEIENYEKVLEDLKGAGLAHRSRRLG